jgi:putative NIF3 family GTP cyclohydrolase 1 type 2
MKHLSRREFAALAVAGAAMSRVASPFARELTRTAAAVTAAEVVDRIKKHIGVDWLANGVDTFKAGDSSMVVTGVVTTSMATVDVLRQAVRAGANLVITAEPTFYSRADSLPTGRGAGAPGAGTGRGLAAREGSGPPQAPPPSPATVFGPGTGASAAMPPSPTLPPSFVPPAGRGLGAAVGASGPGTPDPVYAGKSAFIETNKLIVFRLNEHWNARTPDPRAVGLASMMGWTKYKAGDELHYDVPPITLDALASQLKKTLGARGGIRAVGDPAIKVQKLGLLPGFTQIQAAVAMLPNVDLIIAGEVQEWETPTYVQDVAFAGVKKGFISIGRVVNDAPGMQACADWLKTIVTEVPVRFISAGDPYWRPL